MGGGLAGYGRACKREYRSRMACTWHHTCDAISMANQTETGDNATTAPQASPPAEPRVLHTLEELPASLGQVSRGPLGAVSRRDHTSWKSKKVTDPNYWCGRIDSAIGECVQKRPVRHVAVVFGIGLFAGLVMNCNNGRR